MLNVTHKTVFLVFELNTKFPGNLITLLKAFLVFADTLNISQTANLLMVSRSAIQNWLKDLEKFCGYRLMELDGSNSYKLTAKAENLAQEANAWLLRGADIFSLTDERSLGLLQTSLEQSGEPFNFQQHPLNAIWEHDTPYLKSMHTAWVQAEGLYDHPAFSLVRDNSVMARLRETEFIIMGIGEKAAMMTWLGREWCLSAIGKPLSSSPMSTKADQVVMYAYRQAILNGSPWYDHVISELPRPGMEAVERAHYRQLVLPCKLPDGSPFVASVMEFSNNLLINRLEVHGENQSK